MHSPLSEAEREAESDVKAADVEPEAAINKHGYNLRTKRTAPDTVEESVRAKSDGNAPGAGAVADNNQVGGRDAGNAAEKRVGNGDSPNPVVRKDGITPKSTYARRPETREPRGKIVDRSGGVAWDIPVLRAEGRTRRASSNAGRAKETVRRRDLSDDADPQERNPPRDLSPPSG